MTFAKEIAELLQDKAADELMHGALMSCYLNGDVVGYQGNWTVMVRVNDLMELCAAVLEQK